MMLPGPGTYGSRRIGFIDDDAELKAIKQTSRYKRGDVAVYDNELWGWE
jgi:hypothetical protein